MPRESLHGGKASRMPLAARLCDAKKIACLVRDGDRKGNRERCSAPGLGIREIVSAFFFTKHSLARNEDPALAHSTAERKCDQDCRIPSLAILAWQKCSIGAL